MKRGRLNYAVTANPNQLAVTFFPLLDISAYTISQNQLRPTTLDYRVINISIAVVLIAKRSDKRHVASEQYSTEMSLQ